MEKPIASPDFLLAYAFFRAMPTPNRRICGSVLGYVQILQSKTLHINKMLGEILLDKTKNKK